MFERTGQWSLGTYDSLMSAALTLIGADGRPGGWMVAQEFADHSTKLEHWETRHLGLITERSSLVAAVLDIPIGLPDQGSRACDREARRLLGRPRLSSVFPAPLRPMLAATTYQQAQRIRRRLEGKGCSRQAYGIQAKVKDIDALLRRHRGQKVYEGHPELSFRELAGGVTPPDSKHTPTGRATRLGLLLGEFPGVEAIDLRERRAEDSLDAYACLWTARRIAAGSARWLPAAQADQLDPTLGILMRIWY